MSLSSPPKKLIFQHSRLLLERSSLPLEFQKSVSDSATTSYPTGWSWTKTGSLSRCYKTFYARNLQRMFVLGRHLQPSILFVGKARSLPERWCFTRVCLALPAIIRLSWKGMPWTNTPAYYKHLYITDIISFITLAPVVIKLFMSMNYEFS